MLVVLCAVALCTLLNPSSILSLPSHYQDPPPPDYQAPPPSHYHYPSPSHYQHPPPSHEQYPPPSRGQYPPPSHEQYPPPSRGQYPPPSHEQYPPPSRGQYPPPSHEQYPPPSRGQYPPPSHGQYPSPSYGQYPPPSHGQYPPPSYGQYPPPSHVQYPPPSHGQYPPPSHDDYPHPSHGQYPPLPPPSPHGSGCPLMQVTVCKGGLLSVVTGILKEINLSTILPLDGLLNMGGNGKQSSGGLLNLASTLNTVTGLLGMTINEAAAKVSLDMAGTRVYIAIVVELNIEIELPLTGLLSNALGSLSLLKNVVALDGKTRLLVSLCIQVPLELSVTTGGQLNLCMVEKHCKVPELKIELQSDMMKNGPLASVQGLLGSLTSTLSGPLLNCLSKPVCTLVHTLLKTVNGAVTFIGGVVPFGIGGQVECLINSVKSVAGECVCLDVSGKVNGELITVQSASGPVHPPKPNHEGCVIHHDMLQACLHEQCDPEWINNQIAIQGVIVVSGATVSECIPGAEEHGDLNLIIKVNSGLKIAALQVGELEITTRVAVVATGALTKQIVFQLLADVKVALNMNLQGHCMRPTLELRSITVVSIQSAYTCDENCLKASLWECGIRVVSVLNAMNIEFPIPNMISGIQDATVNVVEGFVVINTTPGMGYTATEE